MQDEKRPDLISNDLRSNANAHENVDSVRDPNLIRLTSYNVDEKFITAKFANVADLRKAYDIIVDHDFPAEEIVLAIVGRTEDEFFKSVDALEKAFEEDNAEHKYVSMGLESVSSEMTHYVSGVWDSNNAVQINN